jgi:hypothetical protein
LGKLGKNLFRPPANGAVDYVWAEIDSRQACCCSRAHASPACLAWLLLRQPSFGVFFRGECKSVSFGSLILPRETNSLGHSQRVCVWGRGPGKGGESPCKAASLAKIRCWKGRESVFFVSCSRARPGKVLNTDRCRQKSVLRQGCALLRTLRSGRWHFQLARTLCPRLH